MLMPLVLFGLSLGFALPILGRLCRKCKSEEVTPEWLENFTVSSYYPMQGLLSDEDFKFLLGQPGFDFSLYRKLRRERLYIFRQYLSRLILDFNRLHLAARMVISSAPEDRSDLLAGLIWLKVRFAVAVFRAEGSYLLCCLGFRGLAVRHLIMRLEDMNGQLSSISASHLA